MRWRMALGAPPSERRREPSHGRPWRHLTRPPRPALRQQEPTSGSKFPLYCRTRFCPRSQNPPPQANLHRRRWGVTHTSSSHAERTKTANRKAGRPIFVEQAKINQLHSLSNPICRLASSLCVAHLQCPVSPHEQD